MFCGVFVEQTSDLVVGVVRWFGGLSEWSVMSRLCGDYPCLTLSFLQIFVRAPPCWRILVVLYMFRWGCEILVILEHLVVGVVVGFVVLVLRLSTNLIRTCFVWEHNLSLWFCMHCRVPSM